MGTHIKTTEDGRKLQVVGRAVFLDGVKEAEWLVPIVQHPNWKAILEAVPKATHLAGRVPLTWDEALVAQAALNEAREAYETSPTGIAERLRQSINVVASIRD